MSFSKSITPFGLRCSVPEVVGFHEWTIENFACRNDPPGLYLTSRFKVPIMNQFRQEAETVWRITLYPNGSNLANKNYTSIFLSQVSGPSYAVRFSFSFFAQKSSRFNFQSNHTRTGKFKFCGRERFPGRGWERFASNVSIKQHSLQMANLIVNCKLEFTLDALSVPELVKTSNTIQKSPRQNDLDILDLPFTDVVLSAQNGTELRAHKFILSLWSDVFKAMFTHNFLESRTNRVHISDLAPHVLEEILRFIYTGSVKNIYDIQWELYAGADKYDIKSLRDKCEASILSSLTIDNACSTLMKSSKNMTKNIHDRVLTFMVQNFNSVKHTKGWSELFQEMDLLYEVIMALDFIA